MGSENSKSDGERESRRNETSGPVGQRLYTEDEIQRALANQKRMFEEKQLKIQTRIYPNLETQNLRTVNRPSTSSHIHYSVTPSAPPENILPSVRNTTVAGQTHQQTSPAPASIYLPRPATTTSAGSKYTELLSTRSSYGTPTSAGPSNGRPTYAGPSSGTPISAGPSSGTPISAGPSSGTPISAGPSSGTPISAGPSSGTPISAGPSKGRPKQTRSRTNHNKRDFIGIVNCVTCNGPLSIHIYQCTNGHSSCNGCRFKMARCGNCRESITDMRNITLESTLADLTMNTEERIKCSNAKDGCSLHFKRTELENHLKECLFNIIQCPVMEFSGDCNWKGTTKQFSTHFKDVHPLHCEAEVNKEMHIIVMEMDYKVMHLVSIGCHRFLVHIQVDTLLKNIYMVTQLLGTNFSASKWTYEWHVYNKREPRRKFEYIDICKSNATPVSEIINDHNCAIINMDYAKTFINDGKLNFKFYIKKQLSNEKNIDMTSN